MCVYILINQAACCKDVDVLQPGLKVYVPEGLGQVPNHPQCGQDLGRHYSVWVNGNWRMTFTFDGAHAVLVDYQDYH